MCLLLKKETNVRYAIYKKYKIIYEIMGDKVYILRAFFNYDIIFLLSGLTNAKEVRTWLN